MYSTLVGHSEREYIKKRILHAHPKNPDLNIHLGLYEEKLFVLKPVDQSIFDFSQRFKKEFGDNLRLRNHVDYNERHRILVYEFFRADLLALVKNYATLPMQARKEILKEVGLAINDMHAKDWAHLYVKPNNIFVDGYIDKEDQFHLQRVVLGDMDVALKLKDNDLINAKVAKGVGKHSDRFSFGLLSLFVITGTECFHPSFEGLEDGVEPEHIILFSLLSLLGPPPSGLSHYINDPELFEFLQALWQSIQENNTNELLDIWN